MAIEMEQRKWALGLRGLLACFKPEEVMMQNNEKQ